MSSSPNPSPSMLMTPSQDAQLKEVVQRRMAEIGDGSHDMAHVHRVCHLAEIILRAEQARPGNDTHYDEEVIRVAALLHDFNDHKYIGANGEEDLRVLLDGVLPPEKIVKVVEVIENLSYSREIKGDIVMSPELAVVQDADRLDAMGAMGIARCMVFTGARGRNIANALDHFDEKLLKLYGMLKTPTGRDMGRPLHARMVAFLHDVEDEGYRYAYRILCPVEWTEFNKTGLYRGEMLDLQDGLIRLCHRADVPEILKEVDEELVEMEMVVLRVDTHHPLLRDHVVWRSLPEKDDGRLYAHVGCPLPLCACQRSNVF